MKQVGGGRVGRRRIEDRLLAGDAAQPFLHVARTLLEHQRPGAVPPVTAPPSAARLELTQAERQNAELDALVEVDDDLPQTATTTWRCRGQRDVAVLLSTDRQVTVSCTPARRRRRLRRHYSVDSNNNDISR